MNRVVEGIDKVAGYAVGILAIITFVEALLRYFLSKSIPDGFVLGQMMQGIAICWGIATANYADRHITVDVIWEFLGPRAQWAMDSFAHTIHLFFMGLFGYASSYKVFDILKAGEYSTDLRIPLWTGYTLAAVGVIAAFLMAAIRWAQIVFGLRRGT
jgi:TRAP-type C4-dicarboxylate transport system permease small subunit